MHVDCRALCAFEKPPCTRSGPGLDDLYSWSLFGSKTISRQHIEREETETVRPFDKLDKKKKDPPSKQVTEISFLFTAVSAGLV